MAGRIFISYRREENPMAVGLIRDRLMQQFGRSRVFFDESSIDGGDLWRERIDQELERARVVVMIYGRQWGGEGGPGGRRIDRPDDMVKYELVRAHELGKHIVPLLIDAVSFPVGDALPSELRFLEDIQQRAFRAGTSTLGQVDDFALHLKEHLIGTRPLRRFVLHGAWIGWLCVSIVWLLQSTGLVLAARDAFDRAVQGVVYEFFGPPPGVDPPHDIAVVSITRDEFSALFGGRTPLDPEVITILLDRWRKLSLQSMCQKPDGPANPIGIALELAPGNAGAGDPHYGELAVALRKLAACRPVVLACPQSIGEPNRPAADIAWLESLVAPAAGDQKPVYLASSKVLAAVLRYSKDRSELGAAVGELARTGKPGSAIFSPKHPRHAECTCPFRRPEEVDSGCEDADLDATADRHSLVRVTRIFARGLVDGLADASVVDAGTILLGGNFQAQSNMLVPILADTPQPAINVHAYDALSVGLAGPSFGVALEYAAGVAASALGAILTMLVWRDIGAHPHRYPRRLAGYLCVVLATFGFPTALAFAAARFPALVPIASLAALALGLVALRAAFTGCEILLARDGDWKPFDLRRDWQVAGANGLDRLAARMRIAVIACEAVACVGAVVMAIHAS